MAEFLIRDPYWVVGQPIDIDGVKTIQYYGRREHGRWVSEVRHARSYKTEESAAKRCRGGQMQPFEVHTEIYVPLEDFVGDTHAST